MYLITREIICTQGTHIEQNHKNMYHYTCFSLAKKKRKNK